MSILDINKLIPLMEVLNTDDKDHYNVGTIMLYPSTQNHCNILKKNNKMLKNGKDIGWFFMFALASNCGILDIDLNLKVQRTQAGEVYKIIEITRQRKIHKPHERILTMSTLKQELSTKLQIQINMRNTQLKKTFELVDSNENPSTFKKFKQIVKETNCKIINLSRKLLDKKQEMPKIIQKQNVPAKRKIPEEEYSDSSDGSEKEKSGNPKYLLMQSQASLDHQLTGQFSISQVQSFQKLGSSLKNDSIPSASPHGKNDLNQMKSFQNRLSLQFVDKSHFNFLKQSSNNPRSRMSQITSKDELSKDDFGNVESIDTIQGPERENVENLQDMRQHLILNSQKFLSEIGDINAGDQFSQNNHLFRNKISEYIEEEDDSEDTEGRSTKNKMIKSQKKSLRFSEREIQIVDQIKKANEQILQDRHYKDTEKQKSIKQDDKDIKSYHTITTLPKHQQKNNLEFLSEQSDENQYEENNDNQTSDEEEINQNNQKSGIYNSHDQNISDQRQQKKNYNTAKGNKKKKQSLMFVEQYDNNKTNDDDQVKNLKGKQKKCQFNVPFNLDIKKALSNNMNQHQNESLREKLKARKTLEPNAKVIIYQSEDDLQIDQDDCDSPTKQNAFSKFSTFHFDRSELSPIKRKKIDDESPLKLEKICTFIPESKTNIMRASTGGFTLKKQLQRLQSNADSFSQNSDIQYHKTMERIKTFDPDNHEILKALQRNDTDISSSYSQNSINKINEVSIKSKQNSKISQINNTYKQEASENKTDSQTTSTEVASIQEKLTEKQETIQQEKIIDEQGERKETSNQDSIDEEEDDTDGQTDEEGQNQFNSYFQEHSQYDTMSEKGDTYKENDYIKQVSASQSMKKYISKDQEKMRKQSMNLLFSVQKRNFGLNKKKKFEKVSDFNESSIADEIINTPSSIQNEKFEDSSEQVHKFMSSEEDKSVNIEINQDNSNRRKSLIEQKENNFLSTQVEGNRENISHKNRLAYLIFSSKKEKFSKKMNRIGELAFFLIICFTCFVFFSLLLKQRQIQSIIPYINYGTNLLFEMSSITMYKEYSYMKKYFSPQNPIPEDDITLKNSIKEYFKEFKQTLINIQDMEESISITQEINNQKVYLYTSLKDKTLVYRDLYPGFYQFYFALWQYAYDLNEISKRSIYFNGQNIQNNTKSIAELSIDWAHDQADETMLFLQIGTYATEIIAFLIAMLVIPIYKKVQMMKQTILQLFATFSCEVLLKRNSKIDDVLQYLETSIDSTNFRVSEKQIKSNWQITTSIQMKKKSISRTNQLKQYNIGLFITCIIAYFLSSIYPLTNYFITINFLQEYNLFISELQTFEESRSKMIYGSAYTFISLNSRFNKLTDTPLSVQLEGRDQILKDTQTSITKLKNIQDDFSLYYRYKQSEQELLIQNPLINNTCKALEVISFKNPQLYQKKQQFKFLLLIIIKKEIKTLDIYKESVFKIDFNMDDCLSIQSGILTQGSIIGLKQWMLSLQEIWSFLELNQSTDLVEFKKKFIVLDNQIKISQVFKLSQYINLNFKISSVYIQEIGKSFFQYLTILQTSLLLYALLQIILFFFYGWVKYIKFINNEIMTVKSFYSILPSELIINNNYTFSYLKNYSKK